MAFFETLAEFSEQSQFSKDLLREISRGEWALLLGAGSSIGSKNALDVTPPLASDLCTILGAEMGYSKDEAARVGLQRVAEILSSKKPESVRPILEKHYKNCKPGWQTRLPGFAWRRLYNLNVDDVIFSAFTTEPRRFQKPHFRTYIERVPAGISPSTLQIIHLHGSVIKPENGFVFSPREYASVGRDNWYAFETLAKDLLDGKVLYLGTKLFESDIDIYLNRKLKGEYDEPISWSLLVDPFITKADADYFETRKIHCLKLDAEAFVSWLDRSTSDRQAPSRMQAQVQRSRMSEAERNSWDSFEDHFGDLENDIGSIFNSFDQDFLSGQQATINDLESNNDCLFQQTEEALKATQSWLVDQKAKSKVVYINGPSGSGKSTSLRRLAFNVRSENIQKFWHLGKGWPSNTEAIMRVLPGRFILIVDDVNDYKFQCRNFMQQVANANKSVLLICASRERFEPQIASVLIQAVETKDNYQSIHADCLNDVDIERLVKHLRMKERLGPYLAGKSEEQIVNYFKDHSSRILLAAMLEAFTGKGFETIVEDEFNQLSELGKEFYKSTALIHSRGEAPEVRVLSRALNIPGKKLWDRALGLGDSPDRHELKGIIQVNNSKNLRRVFTRHRIIAECLVSKCIERSEALQLVTETLDAIAPFCGVDSIRQRDIYYRIAKAMLDQKWLVKGLSIEPYELLEFFEYLSADWSWNYHYWIQRATFELHSMRRFSVAYDYCRKAIEIESRSPLAHMTMSNVCFHWSAAGDKFDKHAQNMFKEATDIAENLSRDGIQDPVFFSVVIRGYLHVSAKFGMIKSKKTEIGRWINAAQSAETSTSLIRFIGKCSDFLRAAEMREAAGLSQTLTDLEGFEI